ncbi:hypothetical protein ABT364_22935 [Massilia sp. SR12]
MHQPHSANAAREILIASGCITMAKDFPFDMYFHSPTSLFLCYTNVLPKVPVIPNAEGEFVIIVPIGLTAPNVPPDYPYEVIRMEDVTQFLLYRAFSYDCHDHQALLETFFKAKAKFSDADAELNDAFDERQASRPPRFQPVALTA